MKTLNEMLQNEIETNIFVFEERLKGTDMEELLDYVKDQTVDSLFLKASLYQFIRAIYNVPEETIKEALKYNKEKRMWIKNI